MTDDGGAGGTLWLVATPIGNLADITERAATLLRTVEVVVCEDTRRTGRLLRHLGARPRRLIVANEHTEAEAAAAVEALIEAGTDVAMVSDAGTPGISDPGARVVSAVIEAGGEVSVAPGPAAVIGALIVSGLPTDRFVMEGFLPRKGGARVAAIDALVTEPRTAVIYESPKRLRTTLAELSAACGADRPAVVVRELTKLHEEVVRGTLGQLVERFVDEPKGEIVLVLGGSAPPTVDDPDITSALEAELATGLSRRDAVAAVVTRLGVARNRVYDLALERNPSSDEVD